MNVSWTLVLDLEALSPQSTSVFHTVTHTYTSSSGIILPPTITFHTSTCKLPSVPLATCPEKTLNFVEYNSPRSSAFEQFKVLEKQICATCFMECQNGVPTHSFQLFFPTSEKTSHTFSLIFRFQVFRMCSSCHRMSSLRAPYRTQTT